MSHLSQFRRLLEESGKDAAIISDKTNQRYLSGFDFDDGLVLVTRGQSYLITDFRYAEAARAECSRELTVLTEEQALSCASFARYTEMLKDFTLEGGASAMLTELRLIKDEGELETIARAQAITDAAFSHILTVLHPEMTEIEVALELEFFMRRNGAEDIAFSTIAVSGTNSARPHGVPRRCRLERGFLTMDFGAKADGYCSDMTRTVFLGRADAEEKKLYDTVLRAQTAALDALSEGASCRELDAVARNIIDGAGYKGLFGHSLGHGV